jgi:hypothetical protein
MMMGKTVQAIQYNLNTLPTVGDIHPAWLTAWHTPNTTVPFMGYPNTVAPTTQTSTLAETNSPNPLTPRQEALFAEGLAQLQATPREATLGGIDSTAVIPTNTLQPQQPITNTPSVGGNGASAELNSLLNSTNTLASAVSQQGAMLEQAQKQLEQQKLQQQAIQQQQNTILKQQLSQLSATPATVAQQVGQLQQQTAGIPLNTGGVATSNPYLVGLGTLGSLSVPSSSTLLSQNQLYSPTFNTSQFGVTPTLPTNATATTPTTNSSTTTSSAVTSTTDTSTSTTSTTSTSGKQGIHNPDGQLKLTKLGIGKHQLDSEAAEAFKKANEIVKKETGKAIPIISSYRSPEHNKKVGGSPTSNHMKGGSIDLDKNASNYKKSIEILEANGFKSLRGVIYNKPGSGPQDEENHLDFKGSTTA